jgi:hypothetical protein
MKVTNQELFNIPLSNSFDSVSLQYCEVDKEDGDEIIPLFMVYVVKDGMLHITESYRLWQLFDNLIQEELDDKDVVTILTALYKFKSYISKMEDAQEEDKINYESLDQLIAEYKNYKKENPW